MKNPEVLIIGGGPCGLFAALLLSRMGVPCLVCERKEGISTHPKAMGLSRRTCEIFRQENLLDEILKGSLKLEGYDLVFWGKSLVGEALGRVPMTERRSALTPCESQHCPQTWTEKVLLDALRAEELASVRFGAVVTAVAQGPDSVSVQLESGETLEAPWAIAADGAGSGIRKTLGIGTDGPGDLGHFINIMFRADYRAALENRKAILYNALGEYFFEVFVTIDGGNLWLMHHFLQPGEKPEEFSDEKLVEIIRMASGMPEVPIEILGKSPWVMSPKVSKSWRRDRIFLVGDAAARLSPAGGLGLNTGLQGVHNLAWKLASVITKEASASLLESYEEERRPVALRTMGSTNQNSEELFTIIATAMRGDWDGAKEGIAHSRRAGSGLGQDLGQTYETGAALADGSSAPELADPVNDYQPGGRPGGRAPHLPIEAGDGKTSTLDLFGKQFVAVAGRAAGYWRTEAVCFYQNGIEFDSQEFEKTYGITSAGVVIVRPDGYVAARFPDAKGSSNPDLGAVIKQLMNP